MSESITENALSNEQKMVSQTTPILTEGDVKMSEQKYPSMPHANEVMFAKDLQSVQHLFEGKNVMQGRKPAAMQEEVKATNEEQQPKVRTHTIPSKFFKGFEEMKAEGEKLFEFIAFYVTVNILDKMTDDKWCIEFPSCISNEGRRILHEVANYYELAHHSQGQKENRRTFMYPRSQFIEKQEQERKKLEKERDKMREKYKGRSFIAEPLSECKTFREQVMRQIWEEQNGHPAETRLTTNMLDKLVAGMTLSPEDFITNLKPLLEAKRAELGKSEYSNIISQLEVEEDQQAQKKSQQTQEDVQMTGTTPDQSLPQATVQMTNQDSVKQSDQVEKTLVQKSGESLKDSDAEDDDEDGEIDEEAVKKELRRREEKLKEAQILYEYRQKLKENTLETFTDRPEPVTQIRICNSTPTSLAFEWNVPCSNNASINGYKIYVDGVLVQDGNVECFYELFELKPDTCYSVQIVAESDLGDGYKNNQPHIFKTMNYTELYEVYVWGNNASSEIGLTDELVAQNKLSYNKDKGYLFKPVKHTNFQKMCAQVAPGNINSCFLCVDGQNRSFVISCGVALVAAEGHPEIQHNEIVREDCEKVEQLPSLPYQIDFHLPVVKVMCGNMFSGLLTADGQVYSWGSNLHGQLGLKNQQIAWCQWPAKLNFGGVFIKDIACGYHHSIALSSKDELYVWGHRMAGYPNIELTYNYLISNMNMLRVELDQTYPRPVKNNLIFYKFTKLVCGPYNSALITDKGELLMHGSNEGGQMGFGTELGPMIPFFPEFRKLDQFGSNLKVVDVALGAISTHILARSESKADDIKMFAIGDNEFGQLGNGTTLNSHNVIEILTQIKFASISAGAWHVLGLDTEGNCYGWGKMREGQLAEKPSKVKKSQLVPKKINLPSKVNKVTCGSLFSIALL